MVSIGTVIQKRQYTSTGTNDNPSLTQILESHGYNNFGRGDDSSSTQSKRNPNSAGGLKVRNNFSRLIIVLFLVIML